MLSAGRKKARHPGDDRHPARPARLTQQNDGAAVNEMNFEVRGEFVTLDHLLKLTGLAPSGGAAKILVAQGLVQVDGQVELRKTAKLRPGAVVLMGDARITVSAPAP